jgi:enediyne biosynthesis protein E5
MKIALPRDPRYLQIAFLASFLAAGIAFLDFDLPRWETPLVLAVALATQWSMTRLLRLPSAGYLSPIISSLGISLLLRTDQVWVAAFASFVAIASKFLIRIRSKHVFNPTTFGLGVSMLITSHAWCAPSQWGSNVVLAAWFVIFGCAVVQRAFRSDVSLAFLASWIVLKAGRVLYLGQPSNVLWHQLSSGSLILFAFFMISDPKTTPDHRIGRVVLAGCVGVLAFVLQHTYWWQNSLIWALLILSPLVPLIDRLFAAPRFEWANSRRKTCPPLGTLSPASQAS